ncbi:MAG: hypothetical protein Greene041619_306 [Candidatus Peregrinibacteria bacterium Greene0416_19]|nr:MAG: hypothetical protein Greene041619_306 [Candidatus Peregrinibacteria bacterium Greene0416_19]
MNPSEQPQDSFEQAFDIDFFRALGDESRLAVFLVLAAEHQPITVTEIAGKTGKNIAAVSQQLQKLKQAGLVTCERSGKLRLYRMQAEYVRGKIEATIRYLETVSPTQ